MKKNKLSSKIILKKIRNISLVICFVLVLGLISTTNMKSSPKTNILKKGFLAKESIFQEDNQIEPYEYVDDSIPSDMFEISGVSPNNTLDSNWNFVSGETLPSKFPSYDNYSYINVTADGVPVTYIGIIKMPNGVKKYYYVTDEKFEKNISLTILPQDMKFRINYNICEFNIDYDIKMSDGSDVPSEITKESIFGEGYATETVNRAYSFDVRIPNGYTARVYRYTYDENGQVNENSEIDLINKFDKNNGYDLGTNTVYKKSGNNIVVDTEKGPESRLMNETFYDSKVTENRHIVVKLTKNINPPKFDAHFWLTTENANGRGTVSKSTEHDPSNGNLYPKFTNQWSWGDLAKDNGQENLKLEEDGSYSYTWIFQTNKDTAPGGLILNALSINGVNVTIPFVPGEIGYDGGQRSDIPSPETANSEESIKTTVLPDGTIVTINYVRAFNGGNKCNQRVYEIKITNTYSDIYVTGGNFHQSSGAEEVIAYSLVGVHADENNNGMQNQSVQYYGLDNNNWNNMPLSSVHVGKFLKKSATNNGDASHGGATVRFKLVDGYINPTYALRNLDGSVINGQEASQVIKTLPANLETNKIYGPDTDGWYYIKVSEQGQNDIALLNVEATQMKYVVQYTSGSDVSNPTNMPNYKDIAGNPSYDSNGKNYYNIKTNNVITINSNIPIDPSGYKIFKYWEVLDEEGNVIDNVKVYPSQALSLNDVSEYAIYNKNLVNGGINVIRLRAKWEKIAEPFEYNIAFKYIDQNGIEQTLKEFLHINAKNIYDTGNTLFIGIDIESNEITNWLAKHPTYVLDNIKNEDYIYEIENDDTINIYFEQKNGGLFLSKEVLGDENNDNTFSFEIYNPDIQDGIYEGFNKGISPESAIDDEIINIEFKDGKTTINLKDKEGIVIYVPSGIYTITETENEKNDEYDVLIDGKLRNTISVEVKAGEVTDEIIVKNTLTPANLVITMEQLPDTPAYIKSGEIITYKVTVKNDNTARAHDVVVTDLIPSGLINIKIDNISTGGAKIEDDKVIWHLEDVEKDATETLVITAQIPEVDESTTWNNIAEIIYTNTPENYDNKSNSVVAKTLFGSLIVTNEVTGNMADKDKEFTFIIILDDDTINGTYGDMEFEDGKTEFKLKHGEQKIAEGLFGGVSYTVTEVEANKDGYVTTSEDTSGKIENGVIVKFVNSKEENPKTLDNIVTWITILSISLIGVIFALVYLKKIKKV